MQIKSATHLVIVKKIKSLRFRTLNWLCFLKENNWKEKKPLWIIVLNHKRNSYRHHHHQQLIKKKTERSLLNWIRNAEFYGLPTYNSGRKKKCFHFIELMYLSYIRRSFIILCSWTRRSSCFKLEVIAYPIL